MKCNRVCGSFTVDGLHFEFLIAYKQHGGRFDKCSTTKDQPVALYIDMAAKYHIKAKYLCIRNSQNKKEKGERKVTL
jgi:hypothetical protein